MSLTRDIELSQLRNNVWQAVHIPVLVSTSVKVSRGRPACGRSVVYRL